MITKSGLWLIIVGFLGCASKADDWIQILEHPNAADRTRAAMQLGEMGDRRAVPALIQTLKDREAQVRLAASEALGKLGDRQAVDSLIAIVRDPNVIGGADCSRSSGQYRRRKGRGDLGCESRKSEKVP